MIPLDIVGQWTEQTHCLMSPGSTDKASTFLFSADGRVLCASARPL